MAIRKRERTAVRRGIVERREESRGLASPTAAFQEPLVLVFAVDEQFAMQLAVTLYSALANLSPKSEALIYILDCGLTEESRHRLGRVAEASGARARIEWIVVDTEHLRGLDVELHERFSLSVLVRLFIAEILPEGIDKAIYLDSDLVVEADLTGLGKLISEITLC